MSFATTIPLLLGLVIWAGILALVIYLAVLLIKALRKYLKSGPVRQEKAEMARSLGEAIRYHRTRCKMTQEFVAESLGVSRQAVSKWESGTADPSTSNLLALAKLFGVSAEELLKSVEGPQNLGSPAPAGAGDLFYWTHQEAERAFCPCCQSLLKRCSSTSSTMSAETTDTPAKMR